ncbi:MAG TPA: hypothetical protein VH500_18410 [Nitrososphaeraceae archaeon]|jgi:hypothetical protein
MINNSSEHNKGKGDSGIDMPVPDLSTQKKLPVNTKIGNDGSISGL